MLYNNPGIHRRMQWGADLRLSMHNNWTMCIWRFNVRYGHTGDWEAWLHVHLWTTMNMPKHIYYILPNTSDFKKSDKVNSYTYIGISTTTGWEGHPLMIFRDHSVGFWGQNNAIWHTWFFYLNRSFLPHRPVSPIKNKLTAVIMIFSISYFW